MAKPKPVKWTREQYISAIKGIPGTGVPGLRSTVEGFTPADGYSLTRVDAWTPAQKRRVRLYHEHVHHLCAQPRRVVYPRTKAAMDALHEAFHDGLPRKGLKAAFIPFIEPKRPPGAKPLPIRYRVTPSGNIVIKAGNAYSRELVLFDKKALAKNAKKEIQRVANQMPGVNYYFIQVDEFQNLGGGTIGLVAEKVLEWMHKYDGKTPLPRSSGNYGDDPKQHHYSKWLNGLIGYKFGKDNHATQVAISEGMKRAKQLRHEYDLVANMTPSQREQYKELREGYEKLGMRRDKAIGKASGAIKRTKGRK